MTRETGKAIGRRKRDPPPLETFALAAEEAIRIEGRHVPLDGSAKGAARWPLMRFLVGVVAAITLFNAPFNLAAHKIAPARGRQHPGAETAPQAPLIVHA